MEEKFGQNQDLIFSMVILPHSQGGGESTSLRNHYNMLSLYSFGALFPCFLGALNVCCIIDRSNFCANCISGVRVFYVLLRL